jgi:polyferredoxin
MIFTSFRAKNRKKTINEFKPSQISSNAVLLFLITILLLLLIIIIIIINEVFCLLKLSSKANLEIGTKKNKTKNKRKVKEWAPWWKEKQAILET